MPERDSAPSEAPGASARGFSFELQRHGGRLELRAAHHPRFGAIRPDWNSAEVRRRIAGGRRQLLARAIGLHKTPTLEVLDATAGLGRDAYVLAALGARVTLVERHPLVAALLADALTLGAGDPAVARMDLQVGEARGCMARGRWDVVYLDPMYPHGKALGKKEMQLLRELNAGDPDADSLLAPALACARQRVVVKRPAKAPLLAAVAPDFQLRGTQARFDVYRGQAA